MIAPKAPDPARVFASMGFTPAATTFTSTSALARTGAGTRAAVSTSGPPGAEMVMARIVLIRPPRLIPDHSRGAMSRRCYAGVTAARRVSASRRQPAQASNFTVAPVPSILKC